MKQPNSDIEGDTSETTVERISTSEIRGIIYNLENGKSLVQTVFTPKSRNTVVKTLQAMRVDKFICQNGGSSRSLQQGNLCPNVQEKKDRNSCNNSRGVSFLSIVSKIYSRLLINRVLEITEEEIWEVRLANLFLQRKKFSRTDLFQCKLGLLTLKQ